MPSKHGVTGSNPVGDTKFLLQYLNSKMNLKTKHVVTFTVDRDINLRSAIITSEDIVKFFCGYHYIYHGMKFEFDKCYYVYMVEDMPLNDNEFKNLMVLKTGLNFTTFVL